MTGAAAPGSPPRSPDRSGRPVATVVLTTHDRPDFARRALASALAQSFTDLEVVVVDDASSPAFVPDADDRVRLVRREQSGGMCAARNDGLAVARGEWVTFLDDDDELEPDMLERTIRAAAESDLPAPVAAMAALAVVTPEGEVREHVPPLTVERGRDCFLEGRGSFRAKNALVLPTDVVRAIGGWDARLRDWDADDFGLRLNRVCSIQGLDRALYRLTDHAGVRASRKWAGIARDVERTLALHPAAFAAHRVATARYLSTLGFFHLQAGHWRAAVVWSLRAVARNPRDRRAWVLAGAAVAGPGGLRLVRRVRPPHTSVTFGELHRRRLRKVGRRLADLPRAMVGVPAGAVTRALARRRVRAAGARGRTVLVLMVYRSRNASRVETLVRDARTHGWTVRLWALDAEAPGLAPWTIGTGPGAKFPLLNRLLEGVEPSEPAGHEWVVVVDDDVVPTGSLDDVLALAEAADLHFVQPAHTERSRREHDFTRRRPFALARRTTFVEIGPVFAVRAPWTSAVLPFPPDHAMGWGLELEWSDLAAAGARLGIVDALPVRHVEPVGKGYAKSAERARLHELAQRRGLTSVRDVQRTVGTWWVWRTRPPWSTRR